MSVDLELSAYNFDGGGLKANGSYDFDTLLQAFAEGPSPHLVHLCEAKFWQARGQQPFRTALRELSNLTGRAYVGELFTGPLGTAVIYDPTMLHLDAGEEPDFPDKRNLARFRLRDHPTFRFWAFTEHWSYHDADQRIARARLLARYGRSEVPTLIAGDTNSSCSGPAQPTVDWQAIPIETRDYKGLLVDGVWGPDTRAVDRLIGSYDHHSGQRVDGGGFHNVADLDPDAPQPAAAHRRVRTPGRPHPAQQRVPRYHRRRPRLLPGPPTPRGRRVRLAQRPPACQLHPAHPTPRTGRHDPALRPGRHCPALRPGRHCPALRQEGITMQLSPDDPYAFLDSILTEANELIDRDECDRAAQILRGFLRDLSPSTTPPNAWIMTTAMLFTGLADNLTDDSGTRWAWYALRSALHIDGEDGESTATAAAGLAGAMEQHGDLRSAIILREFAAAHHQRAGRHLAHLVARMSMAETMHVAGSCGAAIREATTALDACQTGQDDPSAEFGAWWLLIKALRMLDLCGRTDEALTLLDQWRPRLPTTDAVRECLALLGQYQLGVLTETQSHQQACGARLGDRLGLAVDHPRTCPVHTPTRRTEVRRAFLEALGEPDSDPDPDTTECPAARCACTPLPSSRRFILESILDPLIRYLLHVRMRATVRQSRRSSRTYTSAQQPAQKAGG